MGKQKLTKEKVELIKHLLINTELYHRQIGDMFDVSRVCIQHIANNRRWNEVQSPPYNRGRLLYYKHINGDMV